MLDALGLENRKESNMGDLITMGGVCGCCGKEAVDEKLRLHSLLEDSDGESIERIIDFCCPGCAWAWGMRSETELNGMSRSQARHHLIHLHGLSSTGTPAGCESVGCQAYFLAEMARIRAFILKCNLERNFGNERP